jgi:hypothetical protein
VENWNLQVKLSFLNIESFWFGRNVNKAMEGLCFWSKDSGTTFSIWKAFAFGEKTSQLS